MVVPTPLWALIEMAGQRRFRAVEQQQPVGQVGSLDPDRGQCVGALAVLRLVAVGQVLERPTDAR